MSGATERSAAWIYSGIWSVLADWFRMPTQPPSLPTAMHGQLTVFHPSRRYLSYLKLYFWIGLMIIDIVILGAWFVLFWYWPLAGWILLFPTLVIAILPDIVAYIMIHLRYDTIWYAISDRGVHLRRGILVITEHTVSLANIQNVSVSKGPVEQLYGLSTLVIETAGANAGEDSDSLSVGNRVIMVGLDNVDEIRNVLMTRVRACRSAGLGDEHAAVLTGDWNNQDLNLLVEIRDEVKRL